MWTQDRNIDDHHRILPMTNLCFESLIVHFPVADPEEVGTRQGGERSYSKICKVNLQVTQDSYSKRLTVRTSGA